MVYIAFFAHRSILGGKIPNMTEECDDYEYLEAGSGKDIHAFPNYETVTQTFLLVSQDAIYGKKPYLGKRKHLDGDTKRMTGPSILGGKIPNMTEECDDYEYLEAGSGKDIHAFPNYETVTQTFLLVSQDAIYGKKPYLGKRKHLDGDTKRMTGPYEFLSYAEVRDICLKICYGFDCLGISGVDQYSNPKIFDPTTKKVIPSLDYESRPKVAIISHSCIGWTLLDHACHLGGIISIPVYDTSSPSDIQYMINQSDAEAICVSPEFSRIFPIIFECTKVKYVIVMDEDEKKQKWVRDREMLFQDSFIRLLNERYPTIFASKPPDVSVLNTIVSSIRRNLEHPKTCGSCCDLPPQSASGVDSTLHAPSSQAADEEEKDRKDKVRDRKRKEEDRPSVSVVPSLGDGPKKKEVKQSTKPSSSSTSSSSTSSSSTSNASDVTVFGPVDEDITTFVASGRRFLTLSQLQALGGSLKVPLSSHTMRRILSNSLPTDTIDDCRCREKEEYLSGGHEYRFKGSQVGRPQGQTKADDDSKSKSTQVDIREQCLMKYHPLPTPEHVYTVVFTSGSTGTPSGAVLTHSGIMGSVWRWQQRFLQSDQHTYLSYLPLSHVYERILSLIAPVKATKVAFFGGSIGGLTSDMMASKPTQLAVVPRVLEKIHDGILSEVRKKGRIVSGIFNFCFWLQQKSIWRRKRRSVICDKLVFDQIQKKTGGLLKTICCGSAPVSPELAIFIRVVLGSGIIEGYGSSETIGAVSSLEFGSGFENYGSVGEPMSGNSIRLASVPSLGYSVKPTISHRHTLPRGEILIRGVGLFDHYLKNPTLTKNAFTSDGWLKTGDVGEMQPNGSITIVDRIKAFFKTSQGEFVASEPIEVSIRKSMFVEQVFVTARSTESHLVAVIVPSEPEIRKVHPLLNGTDTSTLSLSEILQYKSVQESIFVSILRHCKEDKLRGFEMPRYIVLDPIVWLPQSMLVSAALKVRRVVCKEYYEPSVDLVYKLSKASVSSSSGEGSKKKKEEEEGCRKERVFDFHGRQLVAVVDTRAHEVREVIKGKIKRTRKI
ncbi:hypothetical protein ADUPG1_008726 [Aduncisulcus paluster]|uniref:AMP-dependent synthetase/ligase domain-containing protein n=1 Tax=Aduncisulcus paluster TaxID=2918883 RepID=A0ABQ5KT00_9EUKA|nr:hypothetical protein ADUPG1_008726 [Aduncisulcus paluster]